MAIAAEIVNLPWTDFDAYLNTLSNADWLDAVRARLAAMHTEIEETKAMMQQSARQGKAQAIASGNHFRKNGTGWYVESQGQPGTYYWTDGTRCTCGDWKNRQPAGGCKHMRALALFLQGQEAEKSARKAQAAQDIADIWG